MRAPAISAVLTGLLALGLRRSMAWQLADAFTAAPMAWPRSGVRLGCRGTVTV